MCLLRRRNSGRKTGVQELHGKEKGTETGVEGKNAKNFLGKKVVKMIKNGSGVPDPTLDQAMWGIRREEHIRALEQKYGIHRGDKVIIQLSQETRDETGRKKKDRKINKHMKVVDLYRDFILLENRSGVRKSFRWMEFLEKWKRSETDGHQSRK